MNSLQSKLKFNSLPKICAEKELQEKRLIEEVKVEDDNVEEVEDLKAIVVDEEMLLVD